MADRKNYKPFDKKAVRNWTLYVIKLRSDHYYIGITSRKDFMRRIYEHGGPLGARVNQGAVPEEIVEIQHLGRVTGLEAQQIENDMMLQYRKRYGARKVRGGYDISKNTPIIPTYTPGSTQSFIFVLGCLLLAVLLLIIIAKE